MPMVTIPARKRARCPACRTCHVYHRIKTKDFRCLSCGEIWADERVAKEKPAPKGEVIQTDQQ